MWCVADLDADYFRKMEDVLAVYETPYQSGLSERACGAEFSHESVRMRRGFRNL